MKLTADGATPEQLAAGEAAARAYLESHGVTLEQVHAACAIYEQWVERCSGPDDMPPEDGADVRRVWKEAGRIAINTARPDLAGAAFRRGVFQLEAYEQGPIEDRWGRLYDPDDVPF